MIKKVKFINSMPLALVAILTVAIIIACGKGDPDDIGNKETELYIKESKKALINNMATNEDFMSSMLVRPSSSSKLASSSSSAKGNSSSANASGSSSSNVQGGSSSSGTGSLSSSSIGGGDLYDVKCTGLADTATVNQPIVKPKVTCVAESNPDVSISLDEDGFSWSPNRYWNGLVAGTHLIKVEVDETACQGTAECGTITVCTGGCRSSSSTTQQQSSSSLAASSSSAAVSSSSVAVSSSSATVSSSSSRPSSSSVAASSSSRPSSSSVVSSSSAAVSSSSRASSSSAVPSSSSATPSSSSVAPSSSSVAPSSSSAGSGNPTTITTTETSFPVGSYQVSFNISGATTFRCYIKPGQAGDRNIGTYTPSGGSATSIVIKDWQTQTEPISLGITSGSGTGTFNITTAGVTCKISY